MAFADFDKTKAVVFLNNIKKDIGSLLRFFLVNWQMLNILKVLSIANLTVLFMLWDIFKTWLKEGLVLLLSIMLLYEVLYKDKLMH